MTQLKKIRSINSGILDFNDSVITKNIQKALPGILRVCILFEAVYFILIYLY